MHPSKAFNGFTGLTEKLVLLLLLVQIHYIYCQNIHNYIYYAIDFPIFEALSYRTTVYE